METRQWAGLDPALVSQAEAIYLASFPPSQRSDFHEMVAEIEAGQRLGFWLADGERLLGFAFALPLSCGPVYLLEYLAVAAAERSRGLGTQLLAGILQYLSAAGASGLLFEVEPVEGAPPAESAERRRRIDFYLRNGAWVLEEAAGYCMPDLQGEGSMPMLLLWLPFAGAAAPAGQALRDCIISIYTDAYERGPDDPLLQGILQSLAKPN